MQGVGCRVYGGGVREKEQLTETFWAACAIRSNAAVALCFKVNIVTKVNTRNVKVKKVKIV